MAVKNFPVPKDVKSLKQFLGLSSFYRRFVHNFAKITEPLHRLTRKDTPFKWDLDCQQSFECLKNKLVQAPVLAYPNFTKDFCLETDASIKGLGAILSQVGEDGKRHPVAYASRALSETERRYAITEMETLAVVWAMSHFRHYLYGHNVTVFTDHSAVKAVLNNPGGNGKHARWWTKVYGNGVKNVDIVYRAGRDNLHADALSRQPYLPAPSEEVEQGYLQVCAINSKQSGDSSMIDSLLEIGPGETINMDSFAEEQWKDGDIKMLMDYLERGMLPEDRQSASKVASQAPSFTLVSQILYFVDAKQNNLRRVVVPCHLRQQLMTEYHSSVMSGHFSGVRLYNTLCKRWYWERMYTDCFNHGKACPQCAVARGTSRRITPPLKPIPVSRIFQIVGVDIMELPKTRYGNKYEVVFQDFLSKWPMVFPVADQKATTLVKLLVEEVIPFMGVPEALLSDRGTNLLSNLMLDVCEKLGIQKLNTTAYHPQCNGLVERFNRTLKTMLRKQAATYGTQWDQFLSGTL